MWRPRCSSSPATPTTRWRLWGSRARASRAPCSRRAPQARRGSRTRARERMRAMARAPTASPPTARARHARAPSTVRARTAGGLPSGRWTPTCGRGATPCAACTRRAGSSSPTSTTPSSWYTSRTRSRATSTPSARPGAGTSTTCRITRCVPASSCTTWRPTQRSWPTWQVAIRTWWRSWRPIWRRGWTARTTPRAAAPTARARTAPRAASSTQPRPRAAAHPCARRTARRSALRAGRAARARRARTGDACA